MSILYVRLFFIGQLHQNPLSTSSNGIVINLIHMFYRIRIDDFLIHCNIKTNIISYVVCTLQVKNNIASECRKSRKLQMDAKRLNAKQCHNTNPSTSKSTLVSIDVSSVRTSRNNQFNASSSGKKFL